MTHHVVDLDLTSALAAPRRCPACRATALTPLHEHHGVVFRCTGCARTWVSELGALVAAPVADVPGAWRASARTDDRTPS